MKREPTIHIRLPQELKEHLHSMAKDNKRSVNAEVVAAIETAIEKHIYTKEPGSQSAEELDCALMLGFKKAQEEQEKRYREILEKIDDFVRECKKP